MSGYDDIIKGMGDDPTALTQAAPVPAAPSGQQTTPPLPAPAPSTDLYEGIIRQMDDQRLADAKLHTFVGSQSNPDSAARAQQLSTKLGVPASVVEADLPAHEAMAKQVENNATLRANPALANWVASNPDAARIAHDDFDKLSTIEKLITAAKTGYGEGQMGDALARIGFHKIGEPTMDAKLSDEERQLRANLSRPDGIDHGFYTAVKGMSSFIGGMASQLWGAAPYAVGGAALGSAVPVIGTAVGAGAGAASGMVQQGFITGAGQIYNSLKDARDSNGDPIDPIVAKGAALSGGLLLGLLNVVSFGTVGTQMASALRSLSSKFAEKIIERPSTMAAVKGFGIGLGKSAATGAAYGALSQVITLATDDIAKSIDSGKWDTDFNSEAKRSTAVDSILESAMDMALTFATLHAPVGAVGLGVDVARARDAGRQAEWMKALSEGSTQSKTRERSASAFQQFIEGQTQGSPVENLYIPVEHVLRLYQEAGLDPKDRANDHLFPFVKDMDTQVEQAQAHNGDIVVPTADYAAHLSGTEVDAALQKHIKVGPDAMSLDEAKRFFQEYKEELDKQKGDLKTEVEKPEKESDAIKKAVAEQLEAAGNKPRTAGGMAAQMAAFFRTMGKRVGVDPMALFERYGLKIKKGEGETPEGAMEQLPNPFKESKLQDTMYHGTAWDIKRFSGQRIGANYDLSTYGHYFTNQPETAEHYAEAAAQDNRNANYAAAMHERTYKSGMTDEDYLRSISGANIIPVHLNLKNPLIVDAKKLGYEDATDYLDSYRPHEDAKEGDLFANHDGIIVTHGKQTLAVVFDHKQIKSAISGQYMQPAYHGSPHIFDEFKLQHIGTGEGAQAYGWGLYFASNKKVAEWYKKKLSDRAGTEVYDITSDQGTSQLRMGDDEGNAQTIALNNLTGRGKKLSGFTEQDFKQAMAYDRLKAAEWSPGGELYEQLMKGREGDSKTYGESEARDLVALWGEVEQQHKEWSEAGNLKFKQQSQKGRLYHVELPEHHNFLDWDKPLSEQSPTVREALEAAGHMPKEPNERTKLSIEYSKLMMSGGEGVDGPVPWQVTGIGNIDYLKAVMGHKTDIDFSAEAFKKDAPGHRAQIEADPKLLKQVNRAIELWDKMHEPGMIEQPIDYSHMMTGEEFYQQIQRMSEFDDGAPNPVIDWGQEASQKGELPDNPDMPPEELASRYLNHIGIPGITYLDGSSRNKGEGAYNYVLFDDSLVQILHYEQPIKGWDSVEGGVSPESTKGMTRTKSGLYTSRGYIDFGGDRKVSITLLEKADLSTFLHESGHFYLEVMRDLAVQHPEVREDLKLIMDWMGVKSVIETEHHEKFARAFEAYLMEGKAPSRELAGPFSRFKTWLTTIYEKISNLGVHLTDEVRGVFDRMLATQDEIVAARRSERLQGLFNDAKEAGMTDAEFAAYRKAIDRSTREADDRLLTRVMADVRRQKTAEWRQERQRVQDEVTAKIDDRPDMKTVAYVREDHPLDIDALKAKYGEDVAGDLPKGRPGHPFTKVGGEDPDAVAELHGFRSGDAMVKALQGLERKQRRIRAEGVKKSIRQHLIDEQVTQRMEAEHGDIMNDGRIREEALSAIHSEQQAEILATELRALGRAAKKTPSPLRVAKEWARKIIASKPIDEATKAWRYAREEAKYARAVEKALMAGDHNEAFKAAHQRMLNHVLFMEARDAKNRVESGQSLLNRYALSDRIKSLDPDYLDRIHELLERFDFRPASQKAVERRQSLADWVGAQEEAGQEVRVPEKLLDQAWRTHYTKMTLDEFEGLVDAVKNIAHLGRLKATLLDGADRRDHAEVVQEAVDAMGKLKQHEVPTPRNPGQGGKGLDRLNAKWLSAKTAIAGIDAALLKMEQVFNWLDSDDSKGVFNRIVFRRMTEAGAKEADIRRMMAGKLRILHESTSKEFRKDFNNRYEVEQLPDSRTGKASSLLKSEILAIALNMGNASNADKMIRGEKWSDGAVWNALNQYMTHEDWRYVQGIWDMLDSLWPDIAAMERRLTGVAPEQIAKRKVSTKYGDFDGGYYPVMYDPLRAYDVELKKQATADQLFENNYQRATTAHGHTVERVKTFARPIYLSLDVLPRHLSQVAHDLAYREAVIDADKFLQDKHIREGVDRTLGHEVYKQFRPWLQAIANDRVYDERGMAWWDRAAHWSRINATMVGLGYRLTTMLIHGSSALSNSVGELGARWMVSGANSFFGTPEKMMKARDFIFERSGEMRNRMDTVDRDVRDGLNDLRGEHGPLTQVRRFAYYGISMLDMASALPTWMGAYNRALHDGMAEADAVYAADKSVRNAHGGGNIHDQAAVQRGSEFQKLFTMFYSFWSHFYNRERDIARRAGNLVTGHSEAPARDFAMVLSRSLFYFVVPQLIHATLRSKGKNDEDKSWGLLAAEEIGLGFFAGIPMVRDVAAAAIEGKDYEATPAASMVKAILASSKDLAAGTGMSDGELSDKWVKHAAATAGYVFGLPTGQASNTVQFLWDVMHGTQSPQDIQDWMHGITYGKTEQ